MKFKFNKKSGARFFEAGRLKKVEGIQILINESTYNVNEEILIQNGEYLADVKVNYSDGLNETIKSQPLTINGKNKKVILDMMSYKHRLLNIFINVKLLIAAIIVIIATLIFGDVGIYTSPIAIFVVAMGNDFYYKRDGFDNTFRAVFK